LFNLLESGEEIVSYEGSNLREGQQFKKTKDNSKFVREVKKLKTQGNKKRIC